MRQDQKRSREYRACCTWAGRLQGVSCGLPEQDLLLAATALPMPPSLSLAGAVRPGRAGRASKCVPLSAGLRRVDPIARALARCVPGLWNSSGGVAGLLPAGRWALLLARTKGRTPKHLKTKRPPRISEGQTCRNRACCYDASGNR